MACPRRNIGDSSASFLVSRQTGNFLWTTVFQLPKQREYEKYVANRGPNHQTWACNIK